MLLLHPIKIAHLACTSRKEMAKQKSSSWRRFACLVGGLNQPIWKILINQIGWSPQVRDENKKYMWNHHIDAVFWEKCEKSFLSVDDEGFPKKQRGNIWRESKWSCCITYILIPQRQRYGIVWSFLGKITRKQNTRTTWEFTSCHSISYGDLIHSTSSNIIIAAKW